MDQKEKSMKRNLKYIIILVIILLVAIASFLVVNKFFLSDEAKSAREAAELQLSTIDSDSITKISVTDSENNEYVFELSGSDWVYNNDPDYNFNTYYCDSVCSYMSDLSATKNIGEVDDSSKAAYGLDNPVVVTVSNDKESSTVYVGKATSTSEGWYVQGSKNDNVFTIDYSIGLFLSDVKDNMKNSYMTYGWGEMDFSYFKITKDGNVITELIKDENSKWYEYQPIEHQVDSTKLITLLVNLTRYEVVAFGDDNVFSEEDYQKYGFDDPYYIFNVKNDDGEEIEILVADDISEKISDEEYIPVLYTKTGQIAYLSGTSLAFLEDSTYYFTNTKIFNIAKADVTGITVDLEDKYDSDFTISCAYDSEEYEYTKAEINGTTLDVSDSDTISAFESLVDSVLGIEFEEVDATAVPDGEATNSITIDYFDDDLACSDTFYFIPQTDNTFYIKQNDKYLGIIARRNSFSDETSIVGKLADLLELIG
jgi:hypothetical protein